MAEATLAGLQAKANKDDAGAKQAEAAAIEKLVNAAKVKYETQRDAAFAGMQVGQADESDRLRLQGLELANERVGIDPWGRS
jgi:hypothetical protein